MASNFFWLKSGVYTKHIRNEDQNVLSPGSSVDSSAVKEEMSVCVCGGGGREL